MPIRQSINIAALMSSLVFIGWATDSNAAQCAGNAVPLSISGLCEVEARAFMPPVKADFVEGLKIFDCKPVLQEVPMLGDALLYYGADCGHGPVKLEAAGGAHAGTLTVLGGGIHQKGAEPFDLATILVSDPANPTASMQSWARQSMEADGFDAAEIAKCKARRVDNSRDLWVVDVVSEGTIPTSLDGPRSACGTMGYTEESNAEWRIAHGFAWFADFGQDAYQDFDFTSFTLVSNQGGRWAPVAASGPSDDMTASTVAPASTETSGVHNIAGGAETAYGAVRGWTVYSGQSLGGAGYCVGERDYEGTKLRLGWDGGQWQFAVPYPVNPDYHGQFEVDGTRWDMSGTSDGQWAYAWIGEKELRAIRNGNLMILDIARASLDFELIGTAAVILKIEECFERNK